MAENDSRSAYLAARKLGRKYVSEHSGDKDKGYLHVLEDNTRGIEILAEINITGQLVAVGMSALLIGSFQGLARLFRCVVSPSVDMLIIDAHSRAVAFKEPCALIPRHTSQIVF